MQMRELQRAGQGDDEGRPGVGGGGRSGGGGRGGRGEGAVWVVRYAAGERRIAVDIELEEMEERVVYEVEGAIYI